MTENKGTPNIGGLLKDLFGGLTEAIKMEAEMTDGKGFGSMDNIPDSVKERVQSMVKGIFDRNFGEVSEDEMPEALKAKWAEHKLFHVLGETVNTYRPRTFEVQALQFIDTDDENNITDMLEFLNSNGIAYARDRDGEIYIASISGGEPEKLAHKDFVAFRRLDNTWNVYGCVDFQESFDIPQEYLDRLHGAGKGTESHEDGIDALVDLDD